MVLILFGWIRLHSKQIIAWKTHSESISTLHDDESNNQKIHTIFRTSKFYQCINDMAHTDWLYTQAVQWEEPSEAKSIQVKLRTAKSSRSRSRTCMWKMKWLFLRCETEDSLELPIFDELCNWQYANRKSHKINSIHTAFAPHSFVLAYSLYMYICIVYVAKDCRCYWKRKKKYGGRKIF